MGLQMKITIDLSDALLSAAKAHAAKHRTTLRALIEASLARTLRESETTGKAFKLRDARVRGKGLTPAARAMPWSEVLALANERKSR